MAKETILEKLSEKGILIIAVAFLFTRNNSFTEGSFLFFTELFF